MKFVAVGFLLLVTLACGCFAANLRGIRRQSICPSGTREYYCFFPPCLHATCPAYPQATCSNNICGTCSAIFHDSYGRELTEGQCNPTVISKCPKPGPFGTCSFCTSCSKGKICCPNGCGTSCMTPVHSVQTTTPSIQCPELVTDDKLYTITCSDGNNAGSVCDLSCPRGLKLFGVHTMTCLANGNWDRELTYTQCQAECQPGVEEVKCKLKEHPCVSAKCPFFSEALCFSDFCEKCGHGFYWNGLLLSQAECYQQKG